MDNDSLPKLYVCIPVSHDVLSSQYPFCDVGGESTCETWLEDSVSLLEGSVASPQGVVQSSHLENWGD